MMLTELIVDNEKFRIDDEFFLKKYLLAYKRIKTKPHVLLGSVISTLTDYHANGSYEALKSNVQLLDEPDYAYMVRSTNLEVKDYISDAKYVSKKGYEHLTKTKLYGGELLINKIGSPGRTYLMPKLNNPATLGMNLFMVRFNKESAMKEKFVWIFLNSELGKKIIYRKINGTVPLTIDKEAIRTLYLPVLSDRFQSAVENFVTSSELLLDKTKETYSQAESLLLETLGMADFSPSSEKVNIKSFKDSFAATSRLDAEYYQPKYEDVITQIQSQPHARLAQLVSITKSIEPGSDAYSDDDNGLPFLRVADYSKLGLQTTQKKLSVRFVAENKAQLTPLMPKANTILFSKDGSVGEAYCLRADADFVTSSAILHLQVWDNTKILPDYLTLALNSTLVRMQSERDAGGSIILHWRVSEIENVIIPLVDFETQTKIAALVQQSFALKAQSERLIEAAKQAVETAIETNEDAALAWLASIH